MKNTMLILALVCLSFVSACTPSADTTEMADVTLNGQAPSAYLAPNTVKLGQELRLQATFKLLDTTNFRYGPNGAILSKEVILRDYDVYGIIFGPGFPYRTIFNGNPDAPESNPANANPALSPITDAMDVSSPATGANRVVPPVKATIDGQTVGATFVMKPNRVTSDDPTSSVYIRVAFMILPKGTPVSEYTKAGWITPVEYSISIRVLP
jgi:hypothetical protein